MSAHWQFPISLHHPPTVPDHLSNVPRTSPAYLHASGVLRGRPASQIAPPANSQWRRALAFPSATQCTRTHSDSKLTSKSIVTHQHSEHNATKAPSRFLDKSQLHFAFVSTKVGGAHTHAPLFINQCIAVFPRFFPGRQVRHTCPSLIKMEKNLS